MGISPPLMQPQKYNPRYTLLTMNPCRETFKLGTMATKNSENNNEIEIGLPTDIRGGFFEIYVKGHLDTTWSDWLGGLEVKLLNNGEMMLFGHIGDQAALMGILNRLYGLNLTLLSVNKINQKK
jgi:hypothetical protein